MIRICATCNAVLEKSKVLSHLEQDHKVSPVIPPWLTFILGVIFSYVFYFFDYVNLGGMNRTVSIVIGLFICVAFGVAFVLGGLKSLRKPGPARKLGYQSIGFGVGVLLPLCIGLIGVLASMV